MAQFVVQGGVQELERDVVDDVAQQPIPIRPQTANVTPRDVAVENEADNEIIDTTPATCRSETALQKLTARDRLYGRIQDTLYIAAVNQPNEESPGMKEKCADRCCCSDVCVDKIDYRTPVLRRAREMGWKVYGHILFPLMRNSLRKLLVYSELFVLLTVLVLSIVAFVVGKTTVFDIVFLVIAIIGCLLAAVDTIFCLCTSCHLFKKCRKSSADRIERGNSQSTGNTTTEEHRMSDVESAINSSEHRRTGRNTTVNKVDILRIIVTELVLYPLLMCSMFKLILNNAYKFETRADTLSFVLFLISALSFGICVYIVRLMIIIRVIAYTQKVRKPSLQPTTANSVHQFDYSISKSAGRFQAYFVCHVSAQIVLQILMIIATAARMRFDNLQSRSVNESVSISPYLWFMLISGYVLPIFGNLTFFIAAFYWIHEFPVGLCIDLVAILQTPGTYFSSSLHTNSTNYKEKIATYLNVAELKETFSDIQNSVFINKVCYPLLSPTMVFLCVIFTGLQAAYIISIPGEDFSFAGGLIIVYMAIVTFSLANLFTLIVTFFWIVIVLIVLGAFVIVIAIFVVMLALGITITTKSN